MKPTADELAGVVGLFGALSHDELSWALDELAARTGDASVDGDRAGEAIDAALESYALIEYDVAGTDGYAVGPTAFPDPPAHAEDLPHILDVSRRSPDRDDLGRRARDRFCAAVADAIEAADRDRAQELLDVSYDVEAWAPVDLDAEHERLDGLLK